MGNIMDYIAWRGDLSFAADPFNEVDNMVLCLLSYVDLDALMPKIEHGYLPLSVLSEEFFALHTEEELAKDKSFVNYAPHVMKEMAAAPRYRELLVGNYVNSISQEKNLQMSALEIKLSDQATFVAYRGTDDRIVSWKEDFLLATGEVSAHTKAVKYLNRIGTANPGKKLLIGGHSKGGHMAVYAAAYCEPEVQERIQKIYNNDGPGFRTEFLESPEFGRILERIQRILPEESVVGMLLDHKSVPDIIVSSGKSVMQHDGITWQVVGNHFVRGKELSPSSRTMDHAMKVWLEHYDDDQRLAFIEDFFSVLEAPGLETLSEVQKGGVASLMAMGRRYEEMTADTKSMIDLLFKTLFSQWSDYLSGSVRKRLDFKL